MDLSPEDAKQRIVPANGAKPGQPAHYRPDVHRLLPQSEAAEKGLICSMMLAPYAVAKLCAKKGIVPAMLHIPAHRTMFEGLTYLVSEGVLMGDGGDFIPLTEYLRNNGQLDACGGAALVTELFTFLPTAANAAYFADVVREKNALREVIGTCTRFAARAYDEQENITELLAELQERSALISEKVKAEDEPAPLVSLMDISAGEPDPRKTVLGNRFLCIGGTALFVGPSGIGKSSASVQQDILWSLGLPAFGIQPARPLRILTIQAENDDEDLAEMRDGVCQGLGLSEAQRAEVRERVFYETVNHLRGDGFLAHLDRRLAMMQFDIVRIDPLLAYNPGDLSNAEDTGAFLRTGLNPILARHGVAAIINHHTPKVVNRDTKDWCGSDWMYAGAGSADITNFARAILVIDPTHAEHVFKFIAAKRGRRIGWTDESGARVTVRYFCHADDGLYWRDADEADENAVENASEARKTGKGTKTEADMLKLVHPINTIAKNLLLHRAAVAGFTVREAKGMLEELVESEVLFLHEKKRAGARAEVHVSRTAPTTP